MRVYEMAFIESIRKLMGWCPMKNPSGKESRKTTILILN
ncbi:hypothetical protein MSSIH_3809 [Methanosarcina siciliae HI350]|uniref:Uncharacterized protein n=1 Tax=Methanosarcina siciliae HI350 TaxID=1434119 RepID=A0A0E3PHZ7_9EURY|nr:hypothetical protein MSSIH_3809 [Methanosarcina siciliae HI350]